MALSVLQKDFPHTLKRINEAVSNKLVDDTEVIERVFRCFKDAIRREKNPTEKNRYKKALPELSKMLGASVRRGIANYLN